MRKLSIIMCLMLMLGASTAYAITDYAITITYELISSTSFSIAYSGGCGQTNFACRSTNKDTNQINITTTAGAACQTNANYAFRLSNDGTTALDFNMSLNTTAVTGVVTKMECSGAYSYTNATTITATTQKIKNELAPGNNADCWTWCDFNDYNSGVAVTNTRKLFINSTTD